MQAAEAAGIEVDRSGEDECAETDYSSGGNEGGVMTLDKNCWDYYQTATLGVFPYMSGVPVYRDGMLPFLYTCNMRGI